jgi:hypothetical protein
MEEEQRLVISQLHTAQYMTLMSEITASKYTNRH